MAAGTGNPTGTLIEQWNGTSWSEVPSPSPSGLGVVGAILSSVSCASASSCMAVGYATDLNGNNLTDVTEQWNGSSWTIVPAAATGQAFDQLTRVQCLSAANCWAVGNAGPASQMSGFLPIFPGAVGDQGLIEHWDGSTWSIVPSPTEPLPSGGYLSGLQCVGESDCWASGATTDDNGNASGILMEHWDGTSWIDASASVPGSNAPGMLAGISCLERGGMLGCRFDGLVQQRRLGSKAPELGRVLERLVVVRGTQPERRLSQLSQFGQLRAECRLRG